MPGIFKAPFWCVDSVKVERWWSSVLFCCLPDKTKLCFSSESNKLYTSSNAKTFLAQLFVAMSCDEKNNKRKKKRSKHCSETNSHASKSTENHEVSFGLCDNRSEHNHCYFNSYLTADTISCSFQLMRIRWLCFGGHSRFPSSFHLRVPLNMECLFFSKTLVKLDIVTVYFVLSIKFHPKFQ